MVRYGKERKETPQRKVAGLEWYTRGTCRERSECNSDCYTQWQSRQQKVQVRMREAKTPQHKVAGLEWYTRGTCRERSECNSDCYTQWQSRQQKVQVRMREAKTPQHKVAGLEWYTQADLNRQPSESESDALSSCAMGA